MNSDALIRRGLRSALLIFALLIAAGALPAASRAARQPSPPAIGPAVTIGETELNNTYQTADSLTPTGGAAAATGTIDANNDKGGQFGDWFKFTVPMTQGGSLVHITLTNLPADYDMALVADPQVTLPVSDGIDLDNTSDFAQVNSIGQLKS